MKHRKKSNIYFIVDSELIADSRAEVLIRMFNDEKIKFQDDSRKLEESHSQKDENAFHVIFSCSKNSKRFSRYKNRLFVFDTNDVVDQTSAEIINLSSYDEIKLFIEKIFLIEKRMALQLISRESEKRYEKIKFENNGLSSQSLASLTDDFKKILESLLELEILLLKTEHKDDWNIHFKNFSKKNGSVQSLGVYSSDEILSDDNYLDDGQFVLNLPFNNLFLSIKLKTGESNNEGVILLELLVTLVLRIIQIQDQQLVKSDGEIDFWKKIFSKIPYPMAVISNLGDLIIYNESFAKVGILPKECLRFKDQDSLELFQNYYKVRRIEFPINRSDVSYFIFYTSENRNEHYKIKDEASLSVKNADSKGAVDELGIISSSIAHELNNPLAGILAALSLLSLEEDWSEDALIDLEDMRSGAIRCKKVVEIFLGFSKFSPVSAETPSIKDSLDQAINLLRFRMIESNLRLEMKYTPTLESFSHQVNSSVMSMILYLILSELMTAFAHEKLITQTSGNVVGGEVLEFSNQIIIKMDHEFEYSNKLAQSKLIQHLLFFEKIEINFLKKEIRLIYRSL